MEFIKIFQTFFCFCVYCAYRTFGGDFSTPVSRLDANTDEGRVKFIEKNTAGKWKKCRIYTKKCKSP
ncbi:MAG: hypothetical protein L6V93_19990 [Clostridiales bacterium]|nr:MAG: hypothetical protein L6V93_19990 [Clostridiales bacterium]